MTLDQHRAALALEHALGDPSDPDNAFAPARMIALDDAEAYPAGACAELDRWGFARFYVPGAYGGALDRFEEVSLLMRAVARRDLTVAIAHAKTYLGSVAVLTGGDDMQKRRLAELVLGGAQIALALTERDHGSDLLATEVSAVRTSRGYVLNGEKWLINNATRGRALTVFAKTNDERGPRSFSLFFVDKREAGGAFTHPPKVHTHGIRGADISGICFRDCTVPEAARIGPEGHGLELMLRSLQITRTLIVALSLGAADSALRIAARRPGTRSARDRAVLAEAFVEHLFADALAIAAARALHVIPEQASVFSAVAKYAIPLRLEEATCRLAGVLGPSAVLRAGHGGGAFQKIVRDGALVSLFDGSTVVSLNALAQQLVLVAGRDKKDPELSDRLRATFDLASPVPPFDPSRVTLSSKGRDDLSSGLDAASFDAAGPGPRIAAAARRVLDARAADREAIRTIAAGSGRTQGQSALLFEKARRHTLIAAAASAVSMWIHNRARLGPFFEEGRWLAIGLERIAGELEGRPPAVSPEDEGHLLEEIDRRSGGSLFSIVPMAIAEGRR